MKNNKLKRSQKFIGLLIYLSTFVACNAFAEKMDINTPRGEYTQKFITPNKLITEICVIPKHFPKADYRKKDRKIERTLCGYDFYGETTLNGPNIPLTYVAICPKVSSSNPGVEIYDLDDGDLTVDEFKEQQCVKKTKVRNKEKGKKVAKLKQSISCSYTPSLLAYYHLSRILGNIGDINPTVIRTIELKEHKKIVKLGKKVAEKYGLKVQGMTWETFSKVEKNDGTEIARKHSKNVFTTDYKQIFGALKKNVKKEERYKEFYIARAKSTYKKLKKQPFVRILSRRKFKEKHSIPKLFQLKDYSDMLVLDYLLSQEDRFANIHYKTYYYSLKGKKIKKKLIKKKNKLTKNDIKENNILVVKRLVLKDNDCGVKRINRTRNSKIFKRISHMSFKTYRKLLYLNSVINKKETKTFFKTEALFTGKDWNRFRKLVKSLTSIVQKRCKSGKLKLDLNPERKMLGKEVIKSKKYCEL